LRRLVHLPYRKGRKDNAEDKQHKRFHHHSSPTSFLTQDVSSNSAHKVEWSVECERQGHRHSHQHLDQKTKHAPYGRSACHSLPTVVLLHTDRATSGSSVIGGSTFKGS
jgi:hypothetical protein